MLAASIARQQTSQEIKTFNEPNYVTDIHCKAVQLYMLNRLDIHLG